MTTIFVVNQTLTVANPSFTVNLSGIDPKARNCIVRQLIYSNVAGADTGTYLISSSLTGRNFAAVYVGVQSVQMEPQTHITFHQIPASITFTVTPAATAFGGPTGNLTLVLEFH